MTTPYHEGEVAVQRRAGVQLLADRVGRSIGGQLSPPLAAFLAQQELLVMTALDVQRRPWATILSGARGFLEAQDARTLSVRGRLGTDDPVAPLLHAGAAVGLLAIDLATRQRVRVNGVFQPGSEAWAIQIEQAYGNCPKYIQQRASVTAQTPSAEPSRKATELSESQRALIGAADTLFMATAHPRSGADASHRGGPPGFVHVDGSRLELPDYAGNTMFNALGNIETTGRAGLLFLDFTGDRALHLTGTAQVVWDEARRQTHPGAERLVEFITEQVIERPAGLHRLWVPPTASPFNPA